MKVRPQSLLLIFGVAALVAVIAIGYRRYDEQRKRREEEVLNKLVINSFEVRNATRDQAVRLIVEKVRALGHPEFHARVYSSGREAPGFHALQSPPSGLSSLANFSGKLESIPLAELIRFVAGDTGSTCVLNGHELSVVPAVGTMQRFRRETVYAPELQTVSDAQIPAWLKGNGMEFYDGMAVKFDRDGSWLEFLGPADDAELLEVIFTWPHTPWPPTKWGMMKARFYDWRMRVLGF